MFPKRPLRVAVCGARGIGRVHARIFHALGAEICAVLGSSDESAADAVRMLEESFGIQARSFSRLESLLEEAQPDALSICTPPQYHFKEILIAFDHNIPVFCEKPLFWQKGITRAEVEEKLVRIERHSNRRVFVNTSNASFVDRVVAKVAKAGSSRSFFLRFHTQGDYLGRDIAFDLLPHGLSLLLRLLGPMEIRDLSEKIGEHTYSCCFSYGNCAVEFDFQEDHGKPRSFVFAIDGHRFIRIQEGSGADYRVFLKDTNTGEKIETQDPFHVYIKRFMDYCDNGAPVCEAEFNEAAANLRLMTNILLGDNK